MSLLDGMLGLLQQMIITMTRKQDGMTPSGSGSGAAKRNNFRSNKRKRGADADGDAEDDEDGGGPAGSMSHGNSNSNIVLSRAVKVRVETMHKSVMQRIHLVHNNASTQGPHHLRFNELMFCKLAMSLFPVCTLFPSILHFFFPTACATSHHIVFSPSF